MPELPEVETVKRQISTEIIGEEIVAVRKSKLNLRKEFGVSSSSLKGRKVSSVTRWGKRLFVNLDQKPLCFDVSLGMTGMLRVEKGEFSLLKHDHISFKFKNGFNLVYNDPRRFGWVSLLRDEFDKKGWDPLLSSKKDFKVVLSSAERSKKNIYSFLMDQSYIVGLGNIYVQEILFKSKISPFRSTFTCSREELERVRLSTKQTIRSALSHGGSTILSYVNSEGKKGSFQSKLKVYGKKKSEPCVICESPLVHTMEARSITHCPQCQR